jgi:hypothetical protein
MIPGKSGENIVKKLEKGGYNGGFGQGTQDQPFSGLVSSKGLYACRAIKGRKDDFPLKRTGTVSF